MPTELIHNVKIVDPFVGSVNSPKSSVLQLFPTFPAPKAIVERVFHDHWIRWAIKLKFFAGYDRRSSRKVLSKWIPSLCGWLLSVKTEAAVDDVKKRAER